MPAIAALIHSIARQKAATDLLRSAPMTSSKKLLIIKRTEERQKFRPCLPRGKFVAVARCTRCPWTTRYKTTDIKYCRLTVLQTYVSASLICSASYARIWCRRDRSTQRPSSLYSSQSAPASVPKFSCIHAPSTINNKGERFTFLCRNKKWWLRQHLPAYFTNLNHDSGLYCTLYSKISSACPRLIV